MYSQLQLLRHGGRTSLNNGLISAVADGAGIFIFLVILGIIVSLVNKAGGSQAFGRWAATHIKSKAGACIATFLLGVLIFIDDYFNCLTVGSVMRPRDGSNKVSRVKLAYFIDATAAPVCMIAPDFLLGRRRLRLRGRAPSIPACSCLSRAIPYQLLCPADAGHGRRHSVLMGFDYGKMRRLRDQAQSTATCSPSAIRKASTSGEEVADHGAGPGACDLIVPRSSSSSSRASLASSMPAASSAARAAAISSQPLPTTDAFVGLPWGGIISLIIIVIYMIARRVHDVQGMHAVRAPRALSPWCPPS